MNISESWSEHKSGGSEAISFLKNYSKNCRRIILQPSVSRQYSEVCCRFLSFVSIATTQCAFPLVPIFSNKIVNK